MSNNSYIGSITHYKRISNLTETKYHLGRVGINAFRYGSLEGNK